MIHVINRHCNFSNLSVNKERPYFFSREACLENLINTSDDTVKHHILFDGNPSGHFVNKYIDKFPIVKLNSGNGAKSFVDAVDYAISLKCKEHDIIYFVEDDYLHNYGWCNILKEGIAIENNCWISLYDHHDKYYNKLPPSLVPTYEAMYKDYTSKITYTHSCYWRTACSTTDTFALTYGNLVNHRDTITKWSKIAHHSLDHNRGLELNSIGMRLWTCMPGYSTHMEPAYMSPMVDWHAVQSFLGI